MENLQSSDAFKALLMRRDNLHMWYAEKTMKGWHKEFTFEWLKQQIIEAESAIQNAISETNSKTTTK